MGELKSPQRLAALVGRAIAAEAYASARGIPGHRFGVYGRALGARLIAAGAVRAGASFMLTPVNSVRYWEFEFADRHLRDSRGEALDVSSPRLLSLYLAHRGRFDRITMANPDAADLAATESIVQGAGLRHIVTRRVNAIEASTSGSWDAIWSISVVEHIRGRAGDSTAVAAMYAALRPGGVLILTVPVDRQHWDEYRSGDVYGLGADERAGEYFFQRYYDRDSLRDRVVAAIGAEPIATEWFGETTRGVFRDYERRWQASGMAETVGDPAFIARHFRRYDRWETMPGAGVCGLVFQPTEDVS